MIIRILQKTFILFIISLSISAAGKDISADQFVIGKAEFIGKSGREVMVILSSTEKSYILTNGVLLLIKRGNEHIVLKINDADGKYIRCAVNSETSSSLIKEGEDVYYSDSINSGMKYIDAKKILSALIRLYEDFIQKVESTEDTLIISGAMKTFTAELDNLMPEMKRINSKYPELGTFTITPPAELKSESELLKILEPKLRDAFFKINMYRSDENIKKASEDLQKVITKMNTGR